MKKFFALLIALTMLSSVSALAGSTSLLNLNSMFPVTNEPSELEFCIRYDSSNFTSFEDLWFWHYMEKNTNVKVVPRMIAKDVWNEQIMVMLSSGDLPDVFFADGWTTSDMYTNGLEEGIFVPLTKYINDPAIMPNLNALLTQRPEVRAASTLPNGEIYGLPYIISDYYIIGGATRAQWLGEWLNMADLDWKKIATLDDLYNALVAAKAVDFNGNGTADEIPWSQFWGTDGANGMSAVVGYILNANGVATTDGLKAVNHNTGKGGFAPMMDEYYDTLVYLNKLYTEGLLDNDLFSQTDTDMVAKFAGKQAAFSTYWNPNIYWEGLFAEHEASGFNQTVLVQQKPLTLNEGDTPITSCGPRYGVNVFVVTNACEHPEVAARWADACYDSKISMYYRVGAKFGSEDDDWGVGLDYDLKTYIDTDWKAAKAKWNATDLVGWQWISQHIGSSASVNYFGQDEKPGQMQYIDEGVVTKAPRSWLSPYLEYIQPYEVGGYPNIYFSAEENNTINLYESSLKTFAIEQTAKFISGQIELNETTWAEFQGKMEAFNSKDYNAVLEKGYAAYAAS